MHTRDSKAKSPHIIDLLSSQSSKLTTKIALLTFQDIPDSRFPQVVLLAIEHAQLISQIMLLFPHLDADLHVRSSLLLQAIVYIAKVVNPGYLITFTGNDVLISVIMFLVVCFMVLKYLIFMYIVMVAFYHKRPLEWMNRIWRWIFRMQSRVLYFAVSSFWLNAILATSQKECSILGLGTVSISILSAMMILLEYSFSLYLKITYCYTLPNKNFLASKDNVIEVVTLTQKFLFHILLVGLSSTLVSGWIYMCFNLLFCLMRDVYYFRILPLYDINALKWQGRILLTTTMFTITQLIQLITYTATYKS